MLLLACDNIRFLAKSKEKRMFSQAMLLCGSQNNEKFYIHVSHVMAPGKKICSGFKEVTLRLRYALGMRQLLRHLRRPRGSQSGREKRQDESFQVRAKEPLGTNSHRTISKNSSGCRLLIGHRKCFVLLCPIGEQFLLSSFREFVHDAIVSPHLPGSFTKLVRARKTFIFYFPNQKRRNVWDAISRSNLICPENILFLTAHNVS